VNESGSSARPRNKRAFALSERVLFEDARTCSVCDRRLDDVEEDSVSRGLLLFVRGDERRWEEPELCAECSSAITISALQRWEAEEEDEG